MKAAKAAKKRIARSASRSRSLTVRTTRRIKKNDKTLRVYVRPPRVNVTTPTPQVNVTAPEVRVDAPPPAIIPAPVVKVDVDSPETADAISMNSLRKELERCMKNQKAVEVILSVDWGAQSRRYRFGNLVRVEDGIIELKPAPSEEAVPGSVIIPMNRIVAVIPTS
ncbi:MULTISPECIES: hypothetical protein [Bacillales]|jgi:hypothetical protein|uniref:YolD-like family protein n=1 Tax=Brevibacillus aydinogluensis TaxID=927786 RepID=A0AA48M896_9BACL|nr:MULTISPECIES: hypothetical protein [Bacillales]MBR8658247.1 hypothetical protein [Brevibacillus sp. NL20B1]REK62995.1 MAG: hypothetical protein DF221_11285 [Brevibacillus sp.]MDT3414719.1 hypothetical protein [Brevibacillus aydinogluensis]NNV01417.1 hypothetical protein [Brevibacillus sp. MCWH]UFJ61073.1 hypothetical protein IRT44_17815 [Anoxybacillus sediminis]